LFGEHVCTGKSAALVRGVTPLLAGRETHARRAIFLALHPAVCMHEQRSECITGIPVEFWILGSLS